MHILVDAATNVDETALKLFQHARFVERSNVKTPIQWLCLVGKGGREIKTSFITTPLHSKSIHVFHFIESMLIYVKKYTHSR